MLRWKGKLGVPGAIGAILGAVALCWAVRDAPLALGGLFRIDALSAWFALATLAGLLLATFAARARAPAQVLAAVACFIVAYVLPFSSGIAACYVLAALSLSFPSVPLRTHWRATLRTGVPTLLAGASLVLGYGALALGGAARYDAATAGAGLSSFAFWFVLLAAIVPIVALFRPAPGSTTARVLALAWLYPLARLYSLGAWNLGWSFAALLLGGTLAVWCALAALVQPSAHARAALNSASSLAAVLAGFGLGTNAGIVAACYGLLSYGIVLASATPNASESETATFSQWHVWLLTQVFPFATPFVACWMLIGAGMAGGVALLAGAVWLAALLGGLGWALWGHPQAGNARVGAIASGVLGVGAPLLVRTLIAPVAGQLQAGLTPYGDINIWPWVGLAATNAAQTPVTTWPSVAVALLLVVLCALVYTVGRLRATESAPAAPPSCPNPHLLAELYGNVPWLALLLGPRQPTESPGDESG